MSNENASAGRQGPRLSDGSDRSDRPRPCLFISALPFVLTAGMLTVIQAPVGWAALAWVAYVPLILAGTPQVQPRRLFLVSYLVCLCYWLVNLYWLVPVTIVGWLLFCLYSGLLWPVLTLGLRYCRAKGLPLFLAAAILIVGVERMQGVLLGGFFWRFLAHSQYENITLIQIADIFGAGGVSFLIAMVNGLVAESIIAARGKKLLGLGPLAKAGVVGAAVAGSLLYGRWRIAQQAECVKPGPAVAMLQSNVPQSVKRAFESGQELFDGLMVHSEAAFEAGAELIIWPETMVQAMLDRGVWPFLVSSEEYEAYDAALKDHAKGRAYVLVGAYGAEVQEDGRDRYLARYNSAFLYRPDGGQDPKRYDKIHLVPFGEVLPLRRSFAWFYELLMKIKFIPYNYDYSLDYGSQYTVFEMARKRQKSEDRSQKTEDQRQKPALSGAEGTEVRLPTSDEVPQMRRFGVMICYEDTVPAIAREFALDEQGRKGLDWLINISNDGWFVRFKDAQVLPSAELPQHAAVCVFRAVENRLAVLRSVNTGISCVIDSFGRIRDGYLAGTLPREAMARTGMDGWFTDRVPIDTRTTFFSKYGEWLDFCCQFCVAGVIIGPLSMRFLRRRRNKAPGKVGK